MPFALLAAFFSLVSSSPIDGSFSYPLPLLLPPPISSSLMVYLSPIAYISILGPALLVCRSWIVLLVAGFLCTFRRFTNNTSSNPQLKSTDSQLQICLSFMEELGGESGDGVAAPPGVFVRWRRDLATKFQYYLDRSVPHTSRRWLGTLVVAAIYILRVYFVKGFYVVSYGLATYVLNMVIGFLSPKVDPEFEGLDGVSFPNKESDESKPRFVRRLPEFKFWYSVTKAFVVSFLLTFISLLDVPVFWPILLSYWLFLVFVTTWRQLVHMFRYKYNPFSTQKPRNEKNDSSVAGTPNVVSRETNAAHG